MNYSEHRIRLDIHDASSQEEVSLRHGDNGIRLIISLSDGCKPYYVTEGCKAVFTAEKPDGTRLLNDCTVGDGMIYYAVTSQTTSATGEVNCQIRLTDTESGELITSPRFSLYVHPTIYLDGDMVTKSYNEFDSLTSITSEASELVDYIENALENGDFNGPKGYDGISISRVEQNYTSDGNGGYNIIRIRLSNGTYSDIYVRNGTKGNDGKSAYEYALDGGYTGTEEEFSATLSGEASLPDYWREYLEDKTASIKALQKKGGKDAFSFVLMTDIHYGQNLGKRSPSVARYIMDKCGIKFALCTGDVQNRSVLQTKEEVEDELEAISAMLSPVSGRFLQTLGNHDGSYGSFDSDVSGTLENSEYYAYNLNPEETYEHIYRKTGSAGNVHFDESGTAYYIDDTASKVRYIMLNTHCCRWEENDDGTAKYPHIHLHRFTQAQYDFLINEALSTGLSDGWSIIIGGHVPIAFIDSYAEYWGGSSDDADSGDNALMRKVLDAFNSKTAVSGNFAGTAVEGQKASYTNWAGDVTYDVRLSSSGTVSGTASTGAAITGYIPVTVGDIIRIKGLDITCEYMPDGINAPIVVIYSDTDGTKVTHNYPKSNTGAYTAEGGITKWTVCMLGNSEPYQDSSLTEGTTYYIRICGTPIDGEKIVVTVNEEITESSGGYDAVSVDADFTDAKGKIIGYFSGHLHRDLIYEAGAQTSFPIVVTRCDGANENTDELLAERVEGTYTEQSFDVFTINKKTGKIYATKIGAGEDREFSYGEAL